MWPSVISSCNRTATISCSLRMAADSTFWMMQPPSNSSRECMARRSFQFARPFVIRCVPPVQEGEIPNSRPPILPTARFWITTFRRKATICDWRCGIPRGKPSARLRSPRTIARPACIASPGICGRILQPETMRDAPAADALVVREAVKAEEDVAALHAERKCCPAFIRSK